MRKSLLLNLVHGVEYYSSLMDYAPNMESSCLCSSFVDACMLLHILFCFSLLSLVYKVEQFMGVASAFMHIEFLLCKNHGQLLA